MFDENMEKKDKAKYLENICRALFKGACWLVENQSANGSWGKIPKEKDNVFSTYLCVWAISELGLEKSTIISKALNWFLKHRNKDGGWGYKLSKQSSVDQTARGLITLARVGLVDEKFREALERTILRAQNKDGSWSREIGGDFEPELILPMVVGDVGATLPIITLLSMAKPYIHATEIDESLNKAVKWIKNIFDKEGGCGFHANGPPDPLATAWALRALKDAGVSSEEPVISKGVSYIKSKQLDDGSWGKSNRGNIIYTYNCIHSLILWGESIYSPEVMKGIKWILEKQYKDGGWGEEGVSTTRYTGSIVLVLSRALKSSPDTLVYPFSIASNVETRIFQPHVLTLSRRFDLRVTKNMFLIFLIALGSSYVLGYFSPQLFKLWEYLPPDQKSFIIIGIMLAIFLNLFSSFLYGILKGVWRNIKKYSKKVGSTLSGK
jgi:prenyltransferase beta subunit